MADPVDVGWGPQRKRTRAEIMGVGQVLTQPDWDVLYAGWTSDLVFIIARTPPSERLTAVRYGAMFLGQLVASGEASERVTREFLLLMAEPREVAEWDAIVTRAFDACKADFVRHFGAGVRHD